MRKKDGGRVSEDLISRRFEDLIGKDMDNSLIRRQDAIEAVQKIVPYVIDKDIGQWEMLVNKANVITELSALPSADRPTGEWLIGDAWPHNVYCSNCYATFVQEHWEVWKDGSLPRNFCPNCGAKMLGEDGEKMRLIDADRLKKKVLKWLPSDPCGIEEKEHPIETDIVVSLMMEIEETPTVNEWIPVSESRPPLGTQVITQFEEYSEIAVASVGGVRWENDNPVAWMPLPEPFKGGE